MGSSPKRITETKLKTTKTADNQALSAVFLLSTDCILRQNGAVRGGLFGGLCSRQNKFHLFVSYFSDFQCFTILQLPVLYLILHPKNNAVMTVQRSYFTVLFFVKKSKPLKNGEVPICMRITVNGKRAEVQIRRSVEAECWNAQKECAIGKDRKHMELNHYLETVRTRVLQIHRELEQDGKPVTAEILKRNYSGGSDSPRMLVETFNEHNKQYRELMGRDYVKGTVLRYERTARYLGEFIRERFNTGDIPLKDVDHDFIMRFERFIKVEKNCAQNATIKYLKNLKKVIKEALANRWITEDPFFGIHFKLTKSNRAFLTEDELQLIINKDFDIPRLAVVRDIFLFCAFTNVALNKIQL